MKNELPTVHLLVRLTLNHSSSWSFNSPKIDKDFDFSIPVSMFVGKNFTAMVEDVIQEMVKEFPEAVKAFEAEEKAKQEAEEAEKAENAEEEVKGR